MKIVLAPDSYKGSLRAEEVAASMARGIRKAAPSARIVSIPMADGGEGTAEAIVDAMAGEMKQVEVTGPMGMKVAASYGLIDGGRTAVIDVAAASGLPLVPKEERNPLQATTYGTGELIRFAVEDGCGKIILGLGGSATVDGGVGLAQALGISFLDRDGREVGFGGGELDRIARIDDSGLHPRLRSVEFVLSCDVTNPICGPSGASMVFGPQKGADPEMAAKLDAGLRHLAALLADRFESDVFAIPGLGAAGGIALPLKAFGRAVMRPGAELVMEAVGFHDALVGAELVVTGEGATDDQTAYGKVASAVAGAAAKKGIPVICLSGALRDGCESLYSLGVTAMFSIMNRPMSLEEALSDSGPLIEQAAENIGRLWINSRGESGVQ